MHMGVHTGPMRVRVECMKYRSPPLSQQFLGPEKKFLEPLHIAREVLTFGKFKHLRYIVVYGTRM